MKKVIFLTFFLLITGVSTAQYFGRNKVIYKKLDFRVLPTEHFRIYYYFTDSTAIQDAARMSERWYSRLSLAMKHKFHELKPLVYYANQADFQQTNITEGFVGIGTGGFTESLKNRVVLPFTPTYAGTDHVIGHEMVHEFQYDIINDLVMEGDTLGGFQSRLNLDIPLWMIEGMAEYLSIGRQDAHTAMYLRDALIHDQLPSLKDLTRRPDKYFPYRYGEAFWAFVGGTFGDEKIPRLFRNVLRNRLDSAMRMTLGVDGDSLSKMWKAQIKSDYEPLLAGRTKPENAGHKLLSPDRYSGRINLDPLISPDGKYIAYLSEKGLVSIDLYLADASTGKPIRKLTSTGSNEHYDNLNFINSSGAWSPDGKKLIFVVFSEGKNKFLVYDIEKNKTLEPFAINGVDALNDPSWSPDGNYLAFSGMKQGKSDLYLLDMRTNQLTAVTNDRYAAIQPSWSPDGKKIVFVPDRGPYTNFDNLAYGPLQLAMYDVDSKSIDLVPIFSEGKHINPLYSPDGKSIYFISDRDGFSDIYRLSLDDNIVYRITKLQTGVSGITEVSPAMSLAQKQGKLAFSVFQNNDYIVYTLEKDEIMGEPVNISSPNISQVPDSLSTETLEESQMADASIMPPIHTSKRIFTYLEMPKRGLPEETNLHSHPYRPRYTLDYVGQGAGVTFSSFGTGIGGDVVAIWSDLLGNHRFGGIVIANEIRSLKDLGGQGFYQYLKKRIQYGGVVGHIPYLNALAFDAVDTNGNYFTGLLLERIYVDQLFGTVAYPFSMNRRVEFNAGYTNISYGSELEKYYLDGSRERVKLDVPPSLHLYQTSLAYIGDYSFFGFASPIKGSRYHFEVQPSFGSLHFVTGIADARKYFFARPWTLAFRGMYIARYGADGLDSRLQPLYLGYDTWVRGYSGSSFTTNECGGEEPCPAYDRLFGNKVVVANAELRYPFLGVEDYGLINFRYLPTEISWFVDGGLAWTNDSKPVLELASKSNKRIPVFSTGPSARVNVANVIILNFYYVYPFQRPLKGWHFGFTIFPGW